MIGMRPRVVATIGIAVLLGAAPSNACKTIVVRDRGIEYRVLFAKNGAVQRYALAGDPRNTELDRDVRLQLQREFGPEAIDAPPLRIVGFRRGRNGLMIADKAIDSCGRSVPFH